jgi:FkbM family methyltransferase
MNHVYHDRGHFRATFRTGLRHILECTRNPAYRALHRYHRRLNGLARGTAGQVKFVGRQIDLVDAASFLSAWDEIFVNRIYDIGPTRPNPCLVDVGANIGLAALYWKWRYGEFQYLGFEPDPRVAECCRQNLESWRIEGRLEEVAAGAEEGEGFFKPDGADGGRLSTEEVGEKVRTVRLSRFLPETVDLLKIDVEGGELDVLRDVSSHLRKVQAIFVEWHTTRGESGLGETIELLEGAGFTSYFQAAVGPERPFESTPLLGEFSQHLNIYGVRK